MTPAVASRWTASAYRTARAAAPSPADSYSHFAVVSHVTPRDADRVCAAVADGARPTTGPRLACQKEVSAARVVVLPEPAGPTMTSSRCPEAITDSAAARWSGARAPRWRSVRSCSWPSDSIGRCGAPPASAASMSTFSAPSSSVVVNKDSPTRRVAGSRLSSRWTHTAAACVHLDDNRDPATRRVGEALFTTTELLGAETVLIDAAETDGFPHR